MELKEYQELRIRLQEKLKIQLKILLKTDVEVFIKETLDAVLITIRQEVKNKDNVELVVSNFRYKTNRPLNLSFSGFAQTLSLANGNAGLVVGVEVREIQTDLQTLFLIHQLLKDFFIKENLLLPIGAEKDKGDKPS